MGHQASWSSACGLWRSRPAGVAARNDCERWRNLRTEFFKLCEAWATKPAGLRRVASGGAVPLAWLATIWRFYGTRRRAVLGCAVLRDLASFKKWPSKGGGTCGQSSLNSAKRGLTCWRRFMLSCHQAKIRTRWNRLEKDLRILFIYPTSRFFFRSEPGTQQRVAESLARWPGWPLYEGSQEPLSLPRRCCFSASGARKTRSEDLSGEMWASLRTEFFKSCASAEHISYFAWLEVSRSGGVAGQYMKVLYGTCAAATPGSAAFLRGLAPPRRGDRRTVGRLADGVV